MRKTLICLITLLTLAGLVRVADAGWFGKGDRIEGSGKLETRSFDLDDFEAVRLDGGLDLDIRVGETRSVEIKLDDNLFENLEIAVKGGELRIGWDEDCDPSRKCLGTIRVPDLRKLQINGAGDVDLDGLDGGDFTFVLRGAGDLEARGKVHSLEIDLHGAGDVDAKDVEAKHVDVTVAGAGDVKVTATESIEAAVHGVGDIDYWGNPEKERTSVNGIGDIDRH